MPYHRPIGLLAGFHADAPDPDVPELIHLGEQWAPRTFQIQTHAHTVWEFYLQIDGESSWDSPGRVDTLGPGGFYAVPPGLPHTLRQPVPNKHHFFFAAIDLPPVLARLPGAGDGWPTDSVVCRLHAERMLPPFRQLMREASLALPCRAVGLRLAVDALTLEASRLLIGPSGETPLVALHPAVRRAKELMDGQPGAEWRLADLARLAGVSPAHLAELFAREVGQPPHQYLLQVRVREAQALLRRSDIPITDLALELGFSSSQHFADVFKKLTGRTARAWRAGQAGPEAASVGGSETARH